MADFNLAFEKTMRAEGGYANDPQDPGGETYKGVARKSNPKWIGWITIDQMKAKSNFPRNLDSNSDLQILIKEFYETNYWDKIRGDEILDQNIAESIFDFGVNAGPTTSIKIAQMTVGTNADGVIGPETLDKINQDNPRAFLAVFAIHKIGRYINICEKRKDSRKYFYGWIKRTVEAL